MANRIRTADPCRFNKGHSSKFGEGSQVWQTPEEGQRTYQPKHCGNNNKDEDNCLKTLNDKNHQASSQKFRQPLLSSCTDSPGSLSPSVPIVHCSWQVLYTESSVCTELMIITFCWSVNTGVSMCRSSLENTAHKFVPASPAVASLVRFIWIICEIGDK